MINIDKINLISFGKFNNKTIEFSKGLNVVYGENEKGKSTILAFIKVMLFGMNSQKASIKDNERKKYFSFKDGRALGTMKISIDDNKYIIEREFKDSKRQDKVNIYSELDGKKVSQKIIPIDEESYMSTGYLTQYGGEVAKEKINNLKDTGSEEIDYGKTIKIIKKAMKKNKETIKDLEEEKQNLLEELKAYDRIAKNNIENIKNLNNYKKERDRIKNTEFTSRKIQSIESELNEIKESLQLEKELIKEREKFKYINLDEVKFKDSRVKELDKYRDTMKLINKYSKTVKVYFLLTFVSFLVVLGTAIAALYYSLGYFILTAIFGVLMVIFYSLLASNNSKLQRHEKKRKLAKEREKHVEYLQDVFNSVSVRDIEELESNIMEYRDSLSAVKVLEAKEREKEAEVKVQRQSEKDQALMTMEREIAGLDTAISKDFEKYPDILKKEEKLENITLTLKKERKKEKALKLALEKIEESHKIINETFLPKVKEEAKNIINRVTEGKYSNLMVSENMDVLVEDEEGVLRDKDFLSKGTNDSLYFALRYSILKTIEKDNMMFLLDEAFSMHDDKRLKNILEFLYEESKKRQIIIFTCQKREVELLSHIEDVNIVNL